MFSHLALGLNRLDVPVDVLRLHLRIPAAIPGSQWDSRDAERSPRNALSANRIKRAAGSLTEILGSDLFGFPFPLGVRLGPRGLLLHQSLQLSRSRFQAERQAPGLRADRELPSSDVSCPLSEVIR